MLGVNQCAFIQDLCKSCAEIVMKFDMMSNCLDFMGDLCHWKFFSTFCFSYHDPRRNYVIEFEQFSYF